MLFNLGDNNIDKETPIMSQINNKSFYIKNVKL